MILRRVMPILGTLATTLMFGCSPAAETVPTLEPLGLEAPTRQAQPTAPSPSPTLPGRSSGAVITFEQSGGIAGISDVWTIYADGRVLNAAGEAGQIPVETVIELLAEIEAAGFFDWNVPARLPGSCADCFTYTITVDYQGKSNQVTLVDGQAGAPDEAWTILEGILGVLGSTSE